MKIRLFWAWYDLWVGAYFNRKGSLYIAILPTVILQISWK